MVSSWPIRRMEIKHQMIPEPKFCQLLAMKPVDEKVLLRMIIIAMTWKNCTFEQTFTLRKTELLETVSETPGSRHCPMN